MYGPGLIECIFVSAFHTRTTKSVLLTFAMQSSQHKLKKTIHNGPKLGTSSLAHNYIVLYIIVQESHLSLFIYSKHIVQKKSFIPFQGEYS